MSYKEALTDEMVDRIISIAASMAEDYHFADSVGYDRPSPDRSWCPYGRRGLPGADPDGTCSFGCREEPSCMTDGPYPLAELDAIFAFAGLYDGCDE